MTTINEFLENSGLTSAEIAGVESDAYKRALSAALTIKSSGNYDGLLKREVDLKEKARRDFVLHTLTVSYIRLLKEKGVI